MTASALLLVAVLATLPQDVAETASSEEKRTNSSEPAAGSTRGSPVVSGVTLRPSELVAARVRSVLRSNSDEAWFDLAEALPELALMGSANLTSVFEAAQLAEQAGATVRLANQASESASLRAVREWAASVTRAQGITFVLAVLGLSMVTVTSLRRRRGQGSPARGSGPRAVARTKNVPSRFAEARHLATAGMAVPEIARRTGMAQDAVTLLVGLRG